MGVLRRLIVSAIKNVASNTGKTKSKLAPNKKQRPPPNTNSSLPSLKGISLKKLLSLSLTNEPDNANAIFVSVTRLAKSTKDDNLKVNARTVTSTNGNIYNQVVMCNDSKDTNFNQAKGVFVTCTCPRFLYKWEYALAKKGASEIIHGNGQFPYFTNPGLKIGTCKHLTKVLAVMVAKNM